MFPGVMSRRRRSSLRSGAVEEGESAQSLVQGQQPAHSGFKRDEKSSVVEEQDSDDE